MRIFPGLAGDRMALKLNGKDDRLTRQDFLTLARTIDLPAARAEAAIVELARRLADAAPALGLPEGMEGAAAATAQDAICGIIAERVTAFR